MLTLFNRPASSRRPRRSNAFRPACGELEPKTLMSVGVTPVATHINSSGALEVFAVDPNNMLYEQTEPAGYRCGLNNWTPAIGAHVKSVAVGNGDSGNYDGTEVFAVTTNGELDENVENYGGGYSPTHWTKIGGNVAAVATMTNADGHNEILVITNNDKLDVIPEINGGYNAANAQFLGNSVTAVAASKSEVFALNTAGNLFEQTQRVGGSLSSNNWSQFGGNVATFAVSQNYYGRNEVFQVTTNHKLYYQTESSQGTYRPNGWYYITSSNNISQVAAGRDSNGDCQVFVITTAGGGYEQTERFGSNGFAGKWTSFGTVTRFVTAQNGDGAGEVFLVRNDSSLCESIDVNDNGYSGATIYKVRPQIEA